VTLIAATPSVAEAFSGPGSQANVLVLNLNLAGVSMLDQVGEITATTRRVVVFSQETDERTILTAMENGASAYLAKHEGGDHFVETIVAAARDLPYVTPSSAGAMWADDRPARPILSAHERAALLLWFQDMSKRSVSTRMGISVHTASQYINRARINTRRPAVQVLRRRLCWPGPSRTGSFAPTRSSSTAPGPRR
jgi:two-component system, NarL family, nitrate/nitrite response regulator NarL